MKAPSRAPLAFVVLVVAQLATGLRPSLRRPAATSTRVSVSPLLRSPQEAERELAEALRGATASAWTEGFEALPEVIEFHIQKLSTAIAAASDDRVELTALLVARSRRSEMEGLLETARAVKKVNYQVSAAQRACRATGKRFELSRLLQWLVFAVGPATAALVDAETMREARAYIASNGTDNQRDCARLCGRMERFKKLAASTSEAGEAANAEQMFVQAQAALEAKYRTEDKFSMIGWAPR